MGEKLSSSTIAIIATVVLSVLLIGALALSSKNKLSATERQIADIATSIGLDETQFIKDYRASETADLIESDIDEAKSRLSQGENLSTPAIYIYGERVDLSKVYTGSADIDEASLRQQASDLVTYLNNVVKTEKAKADPVLPVKVEIFEDIQCPFCANFYVVEGIAKKSLKTEEVVFEFRHLPLEEIHPLAKRYARAVIAADKGGKKEEMIRKLFEKEHGKRLDFSLVD